MRMVGSSLWLTIVKPVMIALQTAGYVKLHVHSSQHLDFLFVVHGFLLSILARDWDWVLLIKITKLNFVLQAIQYLEVIKILIKVFLSTILELFLSYNFITISIIIHITLRTKREKWSNEVKIILIIWLCGFNYDFYFLIVLPIPFKAY